MDFAHFGLESGMVFEGTTVGEYERVICQFKIELRIFFVGVLIQENIT